MLPAQKVAFWTPLSQLKLLDDLVQCDTQDTKGAVTDPISIYNSGKYTDPISRDSACFTLSTSELDELISSRRKTSQAQATSIYHRGGDSYLPCRISGVDVDVCPSNYPDNQGRDKSDCSTRNI